MRRNWAKRSRRPGLTVSLRWMTPSSSLVPGDDQRRAARLRDAADYRLQGVRLVAAVDLGQHRIAGALPNVGVVCQPNAAQPRLRRETDRCGDPLLVGNDAVPLFHEIDDGAPFPGLIAERCQRRGLGQLVALSRPAAATARAPVDCPT